jgi:ATP-dependent DNA helicase DinG
VSVDLVAAVAALLDDDGPLARHLPGFEARPGQRAMAAAVARTFADGGLLLAEAGTGTGKTLAYLIPAVLHGRRVLVSTGTKNLQEQIVQKDVPLLERTLGVPVRAACMKGRANYLCLHRFDAVRADPGPRAADQRRFLNMIETWLETTDIGDRAEVDELPEDLPLWNEIAATADRCLGAECPRYSDCFVTRMRQRALEADIVVVNHHLLCADAALRRHTFGEVIPECSAAVIDEAHQLEDVATQYFGIAVSNYRVDELVRDIERLVGTLDVRSTGPRAALRRALGHLGDRSARFWAALERSRAETLAPEVGETPAQGALTTSFDQRRRLTPAALEACGDSGVAIAHALGELEAAIGLITDASEDARALARRAGDLHHDLRFVLAASDPAFVYFVEWRGRSVLLKAMPIDVSAIVREILFERLHATVLTSATLSVEGRFDYIRSRLGIDAAAELRLPSEFDYGRQSLLYLPAHMPDPRTRDFTARVADEVARILHQTEGRAFVLFTSYAALRDVQRRLADQVPYPLLVQGDAPRSRLLDRFRETPHAVLLGTSSFWQGVDVVGEALSCVIIDRLPFASPSDPVVQARIEAIADGGGNAFAEYQVPLAILVLLQGLGRLLRHRADRGVLAVLDPRLRSMAYGRRFMASMPASPITDDPTDIARFFGHA